MDDNLSSLLEHQNSFGFPLGLVGQSSKKARVPEQSLSKRLFEDYTPACSTDADWLYHSFDTSSPPNLEIPELITDQSLPSSATSSLTTPTQPRFVFPPAHAYETPNPSPSHPSPSEEGPWLPSIANPSQIPFPNHLSHLHAPPHQSTWHRISEANACNGYAPYNDGYGVQVPTLPHPMFYAGGEGTHHPLLNGLEDSAWPGHMGPVQQASGCDPKDNSNSFVLGSENTGSHRMPKGKAETAAPTAGPSRVKRSRKRQAPYEVDKDHEGAQKINSMSQQAFQSETPGFERVGHDDNVPKTNTKRNRRKPYTFAGFHQMPRPGSTVGVSLQQVSSTPPNTTLEIPAANTAAAPGSKCGRMTTIRRHARRKEPGITFVEGR